MPGPWYCFLSTRIWGRGGGAKGGSNAAESAAAKLLASTRGERQSAMSMSTVVLQEAKRNRRFRFFSEER